MHYACLTSVGSGPDHPELQDAIPRHGLRAAEVGRNTSPHLWRQYLGHCNSICAKDNSLTADRGCSDLAHCLRVVCLDKADILDPPHLRIELSLRVSVLMP